MNFKIGDEVKLDPKTSRKQHFQRNYLLQTGVITMILDAADPEYNYEVVVTFGNGGQQYCGYADLVPKIVNGWTA